MQQLNDTVVWTALPAGVRDGSLRISVVASPRIIVSAAQPPGATVTLDQFPAFRDWPATVATLKFAMEFKDQAGNIKRFVEGDTNDSVNRVSAPPGFNNPWVDLLNEFPPVKSFDSSKSKDRKIFSFSAHTIEETLLARFSQNRNADQLTAGALSANSEFGDIVTVIEKMSELSSEATKRLNTSRATQPQAPPPDLSVAQWNLALLNYFIEQQRNVSTAPPAVNEKPRIVEFHQLIASMSLYPWVMRQLRLIIDLTLPAQIGIADVGLVRVMVERPKDSFPWTRYQLSANVFSTVPRKGVDNIDEIRNEMLALRAKYQNNESVYTVTQLDPVGEGSKLLNFAAQLRGSPQANRLTLPVLRSSGCALLRSGLEQWLKDQSDRMARNNTLVAAERSSEIEFHAQDVVRGYRVDVRDEESGRWFSLCARNGEYRALKTQQVLTFSDEGWISLSGAKVSDDTFAIHEALFRWEGWSLCTSRPDLGHMPDGGLGLGDDDETAHNKLVVSFRTPPASLPRLRFGKSYRLRVRIVDLAGNGPALTEVNDDTPNATLPFTYGRLEPVPPPMVLLRSDLSNSLGSSAHQLVIRSNFAIEGGCLTEDLNLAPSFHDRQRHVVPAKSSEWLAECHGMFDTAGRLNPDAWENASRDGFLEQVEDTDTPAIDYLPDPLAGVVVLQGLPGAVDGSDVTELPFWEGSNEWPNARGWRIMVQEGPFEKETFENPPEVNLSWQGTLDPAGQPLRSKVDRRKIIPTLPADKRAEYENQLKTERCKPIPAKNGRLLQISLPKAMVADVRIRSKITEQNLKLMSYWHQMLEQGLNEAESIKPEILSGQHERFTPHDTLTLVHAVQQPLFAPQFQFFDYGNQPAVRLISRRQTGWTHAELIAAISFPGYSAAKLEITGEWSEPLDDPAKRAPVWQKHAATAMSSAILEKQDAVLPIKCMPEFKDTKYRKVKAVAIATTRFPEYFDQRAIDEGTLTITQKSEPVDVVIQNSRRPPPPEVDSVIPLFGWEPWKRNTVNDREVSRSRVGGGLRVYLRRPWLVSGDGELLAVIVYLGEWEKSQTQPLFCLFPPTPPIIINKPTPEDYARVAGEYTSQIGTDVTRSASPTRQLKLEHFTNRVPSASHSRFLLPELKDARVPFDCSSLVIIPDEPVSVEIYEVATSFVAIAAHEVQFDSERGLWYSDIIIRGHTNSPFVRLALSRYQPNSIDGEHLSQPVLTDFAQLTADRNVTFIRDPNDTARYNVIVSGDFSAESQNTSIEVWTEVLSPGLAGDELDWIFKTKQTLNRVSDGRWTGEVVTQIGGRNRFVIREYEEFDSDNGKIKRLVFADSRCL